VSEQQVQALPNSEANSGGNMLDRIKEYVADLQGEMRRVTWPSADQVKGTTAVVIATVFAFSAYFFFVDFVMGHLITRIFTLFGVAKAQ